MSLSVAGVWQVGVWDQTVWTDGVWREGAKAATETATPIEGAGAGKRHKPEDWEVIAWLEAMFPPRPVENTSQAKPAKKAPRQRKREIVAIAPPDYGEYVEALSNLERLGDLYTEYKRAEQDERRKTKAKQRELIRIKSRVAALVTEYVKRQKDDEDAIVVILGELL